MKKILLLLIATSSCVSLMGMEQQNALHPVPPYTTPSTTAIFPQYQYIPNDQHYQNQNVYIPQMVQNPDDMQLLEQERTPTMPHPVRACVRYGLPAVISAVSLIPIPIGCIRDTMCLPCDRTDNPPQCYPQTKLLCFFLTCGSCGQLD